MKKQSGTLILANAVFKLIPTIAIVAYLWILYASNISEIRTDPVGNLIVFSIGLVISYFLYAFNVRFSVTFLVLAGSVYGAYRWLGSVSFGEFDAFYYSIAFFIYAAIFVAAWVVGFGFARFNWFPWVAALGVFVFAATTVINDFFTLQSQLDAEYLRQVTTTLLPRDSLVHRFVTLLFLMIVPVMFYSVYIVSINEYLRKLKVFQREHFGYLLRRSFLTIAILAVLLLLPMIYAHFFDIPESLVQQMNSAQANSASFLKKTTDTATQKPQFDLNDYAQLLPEVKLSDETVFATFIDNFFPTRDGGQIPLPVHFRRYVLNRYEPQNEKFVLDPYPPSSVPNDLFSPSIKDVPIGFAMWDSVIAVSTEEYEYRKNISATVFNQSLDPNAFVAPNTGWFYQKLPVAPEDRETFTTAYQCSSLISIWNLPPFMFSTANPELQAFKEQRAEAMRMDSFRSYAKLDSIFYRYYTTIDRNDTLITQLADQLTAGKATPYDKVESVVDYFLGKDETGEPRFTYTLKPGAPETPGQSFMHYFLFDNKQGYCTYFAGATVLLLRAAGIPARMAVGYAIYDRSNKNNGWYWVYADQGHAWVEVYFPSYGWVDFDTTPSDDTEPVRPPKPDATPPEVIGEPVFAVLGKVTGISGDSTNVLVRPYVIRYRTKEYEIADSLAEIISLKPDGGTVTIDDQKVKIGEFSLDRNMVLSAYSFNYQLQQIPEYKSKQPFVEWFAKRFPEQIPVDEAIIVYRDESVPEGTIFAVDGRIEGLLPDSSGLVIAPDKIFYRDRNYQLDAKYMQSIKIRPKHAEIMIDGEATPLGELALSIGDTLRIHAESGHPSLHELKPFLATESFTNWFKNSFPEIIPVNKVTLKIEQTPLPQRIFRWLLTALAIAAITALLLASLMYVYYQLRAKQANEKARLYWLYRLALLTLNQLGFQRILKTPLEYAQYTIDPKFGTQFARFMQIYHKNKYAPQGLQPEDHAFVQQFVGQFKRQVFAKFKWWEILRNFINPVPALRFLFAR